MPPQGIKTDEIKQEEITENPQQSREILSTTPRNESLCSFHSSSEELFFPIMSSSHEEQTNYLSRQEEVTTTKRNSQEIKELIEENKELRK